MSFETLAATADGPVGYLTLDRPARLNALGPRTMQELVEAAQWFDTQDHVRVVVLSGRGRAFCAGADLKDPPTAGSAPDSGHPWARRREIGQLGLRMADAVERMRAVTVARLHGYVVGGGLVLASACDLRVAAEDTVFSIPEVDLGIPLAWGGIPRLVREIGPAMTKELVMTCRRFSAAEARALGFLNRVVPGGELDETVAELAAGVAEKPVVPVVITKDHVNAVVRNMSGAASAFADGDVLMGISRDPDSQAAREAYARRVFGGGDPAPDGS
ncbi:MAG TPA: enoyl-CoA hydratase/isomerase family protein [Gammaproteobacteria bacterium]|nr:enoyl-CoA hydratase/isomerase family protein [Gammaproteobacteria bacterium]